MLITGSSSPIASYVLIFKEDQGTNEFRLQMIAKLFEFVLKIESNHGYKAPPNAQK
jgi:hypothetical protein